MKKILVPVDGSKGALLALKKAKQLGEALGSEITLLTVITNLMNNPYFIETEYKKEINDVFSEQADDTLDKAMEVLEGYSHKIVKEVRIGDAAQEIIDFAKEEDFDLLVMGNRGLNAFSRVMMGSVSNRVINHVESSVLIAKE